jgi:hypothetical protein
MGKGAGAKPTAGGTDQAAQVDGPHEGLGRRAGRIVRICRVDVAPAGQCSVNHVVLSITPQRVLEIRRWMLWPRCVSVALSDLKRLAYGAQEIRQRTTQGQVVGRYWRWSVQLQSGNGVDGQTVAILSPCYQPDRPAASQMPPEIATIIEWLSAHVQLQVSGPFFQGCRQCAPPLRFTGSAAGAYTKRIACRGRIVRARNFVATDHHPQRGRHGDPVQFPG